MEGLPLFHRIAGRPVLLVGEGDQAAARRRLVEAAGGIIVSDPDTAGLRLAFVADSSSAAATAAELRARGLLVHVGDRPDLCDFYLPAIVDRSPVVVAVGTGGHSPSLAKALKERLELILPAGLGRLARMVREAAADVARRHPDVAGRRRFWAGLMVPGGPLDPLAEPGPEAAAAIRAGPAAVDPLSDATTTITLPPGLNPDDLTLGTLRQLAGADLVVHAADVPAAVLAFVRRDARLVEGDVPPPGATGRVVVLRMG
jgi:uroporphyrin-III C-methyltransferase/precorrin-2 dehydrogenase/sirohydrochlorin ferrochelatase